MSAATLDVEESDNVLILHPTGRLDRETITGLWRDSRSRIKKTVAALVIMDLEHVSGIDSSAVAFFKSIEVFCEDQGIAYGERSASDHIREFLRYTRAHSSLHRQQPTPPPAPAAITALGLMLKEKAWQWHNLMEFIGNFLITVAGRIRHPRKFHLHEILYQLQAVGVNAFFLIAALSFLLGILMVFQGSSQGLGSAIFVADMVVIAVTREMAPLVVAVALAGRSGSAFASEIGAMKVNEELDALAVMNMDVIRMIVLPRVFALAVAEPILTMIADVVGIVGGMTTAKVHLNMSVVTFLHEAQGVLTPADIFTGLVKAFTSGGITGFIGCYSGLKAERESGSVRIQTTRAVVQSIFAVIAIDTVYSYVFNLYGW